MQNKLDTFKTFLKGKRIAVLGVGISNRPLIRFIAGLGGDITAFDMLETDDPVLSRSRQALEQEGINLSWCVGKNYLDGLKGFDVIFRTPKVRSDLPELLAERERGAVITSEMEVFMELCPAKMFGVTGSDGKTTTTTLISLILRQAGYTVHVGGNIGTPLLDKIEQVKPQDMVVLELSSFQLMSMRKSPDVAVVTNITPNHLDVHKDYQEYIDAKKNILLYQPFYGRLALNCGHYETRALSPDARGEVVWFANHPDEDLDGFFLVGSKLCRRQGNDVEVILDKDEIKIPGKHNVENYLAASAAIWPFVKREHIAQVAKTFGGVEHRLELVRELDGVRYYNSSIDTSPTRTKAALKALSDRNERVVLIAGGADKKCDYTGLGEAIVTVSSRIILCGANSDLIDASIRREAAHKGILYDDLTIIRCKDYDDAVSQARELAKPGEVVVLSPAGTSFDAFRHFEERGNLFKSLVHDLK